MHSYFFRVQEKIFLDKWNHADSYTQRAFSWLPEISNHLGKTFCLFQLNWPPESLIYDVPKNIDTYVIHFGAEYVDWKWLNQFCKNFPKSRVVLVSPYDVALYAEPNLHLIQFNFWPHILKWYQEENNLPKIEISKKTKKLSSLANRVSQFRSYVCAYLHQTWNDADYLISWRGTIGKQEDLYLLNQTGNPKVDSVIDYLKSTFFDLRISPDGNFTNQALDNLFYNWSAYTDCVVNCSNESVNNSFQQTDAGSYIVPGPYFTEKTWKCLLSETALLPVGQYKSYEKLQEQGFNFEYPWDCSFDQTPKDIDRIAKILNSLDQIDNMSLDFLKSSTQKSNQHNRDHILSGRYFDQENLVNLNNVEKFTNNIG